MVKEEISVIIGPDSPNGNEIVQAVARRLQIPQIQTFWNPKLAAYATRTITESEKPTMIYNVYPEEALSKALATLVRESGWKTYTIIYENDDGLIRLQEVLKSRNPSDLPVTIRRLEGSDHRSVVSFCINKKLFRTDKLIK